MGKASYKRLTGSQNLRQRLVLAAVASTPVLIEDIRAEETWPGLRPHEVSFLRLLEKVSDDCVVEINETGTKLKFKPGIVMGGRNLVHDCGLSRAVGYFLEPLIVLGLFAKKPLTITLKGITNDSEDPSVDTFRSATLPMLKHFGVPSEGLDLKIQSRGSAPQGGGEVFLSIPIVQSLTSTGLMKGWLRGLEGLHSQQECPHSLKIPWCMQLVESLISYSQMFTYLQTIEVAHKLDKTTSGCCISADTAISYSRGEDTAELEDEGKKELMPPEDVGVQIANVLLGEIEQGGVVDSTHQGFLFLLCALCPQDVSKVRVGKLSPHGIETLRNIKDFLGVKFVIKPDPSTGTVILRCVGSGLRNLSRRIS
ncbi:probable RNA 3'-terminal phosphate cyclase-like protein isoform X2 [Pyrus x bretschneideri]|uniref:probable RNA 3'-terminal phosphate cyclase-like protein isoform X2 n=1 Tax=Pyrus x bretschneideri TaxID=225117 RepID=UPI002030BA5F|nr:probable RNA 3'-terminal phosphate cyclase-like protein isoform X2 [Pyrus x bretschneideri]